MNLLTARDAAEYLHVSLFTLGRIEKEGLLVPFRTPGGHRRYSLDMLNEYLEQSRSRRGERERRILVVDDGNEVVDRLAHTFSSCRFSWAGDELRVGMKLAEFEPDLVFVNTTMSGLDGSDLCRQLDRQELKVLAFEAPRGVEGPPKGTGFDLSNLSVLEERIQRLLVEGS